MRRRPSSPATPTAFDCHRREHGPPSAPPPSWRCSPPPPCTGRSRADGISSPTAETPRAAPPLASPRSAATGTPTGGLPTTRSNPTPPGVSGPAASSSTGAATGRRNHLIRNPHSLYLQKLSELGLAGFVAIVIAIAGLLWGAIEARRRWIGEADLAAGAGLIAAFVVFVVYAGVDWMWEMGAIGTLALGGAAVVGAARFRRAAPLGGWARAGLTLAALVAAASMVPSLVSTQRTRASGTALARGDLAQAVQLADDAIRAEPWAASPYAQKALALQAEGRLAEARDEINRAVDHERANWRYLLIRAQIDSRAGDEALGSPRPGRREVSRPALSLPAPGLVLPPERPRCSAQRTIPARSLICLNDPLVLFDRPGARVTWSDLPRPEA